jgi:hypothetical protein
VEKYKSELNLNTISKTEAPLLLKHFFIERYFPERPCPPASDNFDIEKSTEVEEVANMLSVRKEKRFEEERLGKQAKRSAAT